MTERQGRVSAMEQFLLTQFGYDGSDNRHILDAMVALVDLSRLDGFTANDTYTLLDLARASVDQHPLDDTPDRVYVAPMRVFLFGEDMSDADVAAVQSLYGPELTGDPAFRKEGGCPLTAVVQGSVEATQKRLAMCVPQNMLFDLFVAGVLVNEEPIRGELDS